MGVFAVSMLCCVTGVLMTFVFAPGQALRANGISRLPQMDVETVSTASVGDTILVTGMLHGDAGQAGVPDLIAFEGERWDVTVPEPDEDGTVTPYGRWNSIPSVVPDLTMEINGQSVTIQAASGPSLTGNLHEVIIPGDGETTAKSEGQSFNDGTLRYHGFVDGDLVTVYGKKSASGGIDPKNLFAGDRSAFEESQKEASKGILYSGICMFILTPIVLFGGLFWVVFKRR